MTRMLQAIISCSQKDSLHMASPPATTWLGDDGVSIAIWSTCDWAECAIKISADLFPNS